MKNLYCIAVLGLTCYFGPSLYAQQGKVDPTFNTYDDGSIGDGFDNTVRTLALQSDGKLLVGGEFLTFNGTATSYLCRLLPDGNKDTSFNLGLGFNNKIYRCLIQPDGKILVCGSFTQFNGTNVGRIVRLNTDGTLDTSFASYPAATTNTIYDLALCQDGSIILVGSFTKFNGISTNRIVKLMANGTVDTSFSIGTGASGVIEKVKIQADGKIIIAGEFKMYNDLTVNKIARLDTNGSLDTSFITGSGFDNNVSAIEIQNDGKIVLGGSFTTYNGNSANRLIRINPDASVDTSFNSGTGFNDGSVEAIFITSSGNLMIGGSFTSNYNGTAVNRLQLLKSDGTIDTTFDIGNGPATARVYTLENYNNESWYIGGSFSVFDDQNQGKLAKLDTQGALDISYLATGVGFNDSVTKILPLSDKNMIVVGNFLHFNGVTANRIAKLNEDGTRNLSFNAAIFGANATIRNATMQYDGRIIIVGNFTNYDGTPVNRIARLLPDGNLDTTFNVGLGCNGNVYATAIQKDGKIIIVGNFSTYNGTPAVKIARILSDGTLDTSFNTGLGAENGIIETIALQEDGKIVIAGHFTSFNGVACNRISRLNSDGSIDTSFTIGTGFDATVYCLALQTDGKIIAGGSFLNYNGNSSKRLARLNADGSLDTNFGIGTGFSNGTVRTILIQPNGKLLIGGTFTGTYKGVSVKRMLRIHIDGGIDGSFSVNLNGTLLTLALTTDEKLLIGGSFNSISGITKHRIARLLLCIDQTKRSAGNWTNGLPSPGKELLFEENFSINSETNACNCSITSGYEVKITSGNTFTIRYQYEGNGILKVENNGSFIQLDDQIGNTGTIAYHRRSSPMKNFDYTYWSSPVVGQTAKNLSPNTLPDKYFIYNPTTGWVFDDGEMKPGVGYIIRVPKPGTYPNGESWNTPTYQQPVVFKGIPNNGKYTFVTGPEEFNLIGNPYPSAIDAEKFMKANSKIISGPLYFWTHNTAIKQSGSNYIYVADDYATFNFTGGTGTATGSALSTKGAGTIPNGYIAAGQSFFVGSQSSPTATEFEFNNAMRVAGNNTQFFKQSASKKSAEIEKNRLWLNLTNAQGAFKQLLIGYVEGATNDWDHLYDGRTINGQTYIDFYSINSGNNLTIQGRTLPFDENDQVPLGYSSTIAGPFDIGIDNRDGNLINQPIWLEDKKMGITHDLTQGKYTFTSINGTENDRFILKYTNKTLGLSTTNSMANSIVINVKSKTINIHSSNENIEKITVFDLIGRKLYEKPNINTQNFTIHSIVTNGQVLIVKTSLENGSLDTQKIKY